MKQKDIAKLVFVAIVAGLLSSVVAKAAFSAAQKPTKVPVVPVISSDFPDIKNDPTYKAFFNSDALDPTQLIQIGGSQNTTPFNSQ